MEPQVILLEVERANAVTRSLNRLRERKESATEITSLKIITSTTNILEPGLSRDLDLYAPLSLRGLTDS